MIEIFIFAIIMIIVILANDHWEKILDIYNKIRFKLKKECKAEIKIKNYRIISNKIKCNDCGDIIESKHRHDYVDCKCGKVSVDGGKDYLKRRFTEEGDYEELSETEEIIDE